MFGSLTCAVKTCFLQAASLSLFFGNQHAARKTISMRTKNRSPVLYFTFIFSYQVISLSNVTTGIIVELRNSQNLSLITYRTVTRRQKIGFKNDKRKGKRSFQPKHSPHPNLLNFPDTVKKSFSSLCTGPSWRNSWPK